jgi:hypothetical protein
MLNFDRRGRVESFLEQLMNMRARITALLSRSPRRTVGLREPCEEASACALYPLVGGLGAHAQQPAYLAGRPSLGVVKHNRNPIRGRELAQRSPQYALILCGSDYQCGILDIRDQAVELLRRAHREISAATMRVNYPPRQDAAQPTTGGAGVADLFACLPCALKRVLHGVLGVVFLSRKTPREGQQRR